MKAILLAVITVLLFFNAFAQDANKNNAGRPAESQKEKKEDKYELIERYFFDSSKHWKVNTTVTENGIFGKGTTVIAAQLRQGESYKYAYCRFRKKVYFLGMLITVDQPDRISLYLQVKDTEGVKSILQVSYTKGDEPVVKEVDRNNKKEWERINDMI